MDKLKKEAASHGIRLTLNSETGRVRKSERLLKEEISNAKSAKAKKLTAKATPRKRKLSSKSKSGSKSKSDPGGWVEVGKKKPSKGKHVAKQPTHAVYGQYFLTSAQNRFLETIPLTRPRGTTRDHALFGAYKKLEGVANRECRKATTCQEHKKCANIYRQIRDLRIRHCGGGGYPLCDRGHVKQILIKEGMQRVHRTKQNNEC